jgi:HNH endonuclease
MLAARVESVPRDSEQPLTAELSRLHVTVSRRFLAKLEAARDALSHARPGATTEDLREAGLDLLLERQAKRNGLVEKPRKSKSSPTAVTMTAPVKREVWRRDGGRCQWPVESGGVCGSARRIQFDHIIPRAAGGLSTVDNVRLLCRMHNDLAARRVFGDGWMNRFTGNRRQGTSATVA